MNHRTLLATALVAVAFVTPAARLAPDAPALPGPGGVYSTILAFQRALDAGDADRAAELLSTGDLGGVAIVDDGVAVARFIDIGADGRVVAAAADAGIREQFTPAIASDSERGVRVTHSITRVHADCPSGRLSYAIVEFDRTWSRRGSPDVRIPMRATVLARHVGGEGPEFRITHWHASPAATAATDDDDR